MSNSPREMCIPIRAELSAMGSKKQTYGCRQANPDICRYCYIEGICAFSSKDCIFKHPSAKWKKIYKELREAENEVL